MLDDRFLETVLLMAGAYATVADNKWLQCYKLIDISLATI
jgi:hypothetical protein